MCINPAMPLSFSLAKLAGHLDRIVLPLGQTTAASGRLHYTSMSVIAGGWSPRGSIEISWQRGIGDALHIHILRERGTGNAVSSFVETFLIARADATHTPLEWHTRSWSGSEFASPAIPGTQLEYCGTFAQNRVRINCGSQIIEYPCNTLFMDSVHLLIITPRLVQVGLPLTLSLLNDFRTISPPVRMISVGRTAIRCGATSLPMHELQLTGPGQLPASLFVDESDRVVLHVCGAEVHHLTACGPAPQAPRPLTH